jgi:C4-type Zn-finger protein|nr:MAG: Zn finger protein [Thermoproteus sp. AZ2]
MWSPPYVLDLDYLTICPSCGRPMKEDSRIMRLEHLTGNRILERVLICANCRVKIREVVYLPK